MLQHTFFLITHTTHVDICLYTLFLAKPDYQIFKGQIGSASGSGAVKMKLWRKKQELNPRPKLPKSHEEYMSTENIPDKYIKTADNGNFIIFQDWVDEAKTESMVMFMSDWGAEILKMHSTWLFDGTFQSCPAPFSQLYVCMAAPETGGKGIPVGWFLLPNKNSKTYEMAFKAILDKLGGQPTALKTVVSDFEMAVFRSVKKVFKNVDHKGCRFHKNAAIWKNLGDHGLQGLFHQSPAFQELIHKLYALCYVKIEDVVPIYHQHILPDIQKGIDENEDWQEYSDELQDFGDYYELTWIERQNHGAPRFPPSTWNHHDTIMNDGIQTNNHLESYNRTWNRLAGKDSNIWAIQELFVKQEANARRSFLSNAVGQDTSANTGRKERSLDGRTRIKFLLGGYDTMSKKDLILMLAHDMQK